MHLPGNRFDLVAGVNGRFAGGHGGGQQQARLARSLRFRCESFL